jgi:hypothetical protein
MYRSHSLAHSIAAFGVVALLAGCSESGPELLQARGTVTLDGKPVPNALVTFAPKDGTGSPSNGLTDAAGQYTLRFNRDREGVLPGTHRVTIETAKVSPDDVPAGQAVPEFVPLPKKYSQPGELTADVSESSEKHDFALTSK